MHLLYPSLCIVVAIALMKEKRGPSSFMVASAAVVCIPSGMPVSYHSGALGFFRKQPGAEDRTEAPAEGGTRVEVSGRGTWNAQADGRSQPSTPDGALSPIERRAA